jgi:hypothetical protein
LAIEDLFSFLASKRNNHADNITRHGNNVKRYYPVFELPHNKVEAES